MNKKILFFSTFFIILILVNFPSLIRYYYNYQGEKFFVEENFEKAETYFSKANNELGIYNLGNIYYKEKKYTEAINNYLLVGNKNTGEISFRSFHNLGNSYYKLGKENAENRLELYLTSVSYYEKALKIKYDEDTKQNRDFVLEKIKELQKEQSDENENNGEGNNDSSNDKSKENDSKNNNDGEEDSQNTSEKESSIGENQEENNGEQLSEEIKGQLEQYQEILKEEQEQYQEGFNKIYQQGNNFEDDFFNDFMFAPFFDNSILENKEKDW